ncbi:hypothetical protein [Thermanaeromonas toyohensis]|nr:hypothetical protein [Thermanaeromonas toyohensis]
MNQAKKRGNIGPEKAERLKQICREKGVEVARQEYDRLKRIKDNLRRIIL